MWINSFFGQIGFTEFGSDHDPAINAIMNGLVNISGQQLHISKENHAKQKNEHYNIEDLYLGFAYDIEGIVLFDCIVLEIGSRKMLVMAPPDYREYGRTELSK